MSRSVSGWLGAIGGSTGWFAASSVVLAIGVSGCEAGSADVSGTANGIKFGESSWVYWGARYVIISAIELECQGLPWVEQNYSDEEVPTDLDTSVLQFTFAGELIEAGKYSVAQGAQVQATVVNVTGGVFHADDASAGTFELDSVEDEGDAAGSFESIAFEDGTLDGTYTAQWCRTLKP